MANNKPDLTTIKARLSSDGDEDAPKPLPRPQESRISKETKKQVAEFSRDMHRLAEEEAKKAEERVDLGPLPEGVASEAKDDMFYRNTSFDNAKVRAAIESKCGEMDFADLIMTGRVIQDVPILKGKLHVTFQSLLGSETFWAERHAADYSNTDWALRSWMGYARLTMSITSLNGSEFSDHKNKSGEVTKELFDRKYTEVMALGEKVIELLFVNLTWFNDRVEKLYQNDFELLKNG